MQHSFQIKTPNPPNLDVHKGYERTKRFGLLAPFPARLSVYNVQQSKVYCILIVFGLFLHPLLHLPTSLLCCL